MRRAIAAGEESAREGVIRDRRPLGPVTTIPPQTSFCGSPAQMMAEVA